MGQGLIPLYKPSPILAGESTGMQRRKDVAVGDIGYFDKKGSFVVLFNIFWGKEENRACELLTPPDYARFQSPQSPQFQHIPERNETKICPAEANDPTTIDSDDPTVIETRVYARGGRNIWEYMNITHDEEEWERLIAYFGSTDNFF